MRDGAAPCPVESILPERNRVNLTPTGGNTKVVRRRNDNTPTAWQVGGIKVAKALSRR